MLAVTSSVTLHRDSQLSPCGICKQEIPAEEVTTKAQVFWHSNVSRGAHVECCKEIELFDRELEKGISTLFPKQHHKCNEAHSKAVRTMEKILGKTTLLEFVRANKRQPAPIVELFRKALYSLIPNGSIE